MEINKMFPNLTNNLDIKNNFALFKNIKSIKAKEANKSLRSITKQLSTPIETNQKDIFLVGPYKLGPEGQRANQNIEAVSALIFDIDSPKGYTFDDIVALASDYFGVLHTTWSHTDKAPRYRLILHLIEEIAASNFSEVRDNFLFFNPELAGIIDVSCKDISRAYYWFSYPPERSGNAQCCVLMGNPINPRHLKTPEKRNYFLNLLGVSTPQTEGVMQGQIVEGYRNKSLASLVGRLINQGLTRNETYEEAIRWNKSVLPPLGIDEVERTHNSIWKTHLSKNPECDKASREALQPSKKNFELIPAGNLLATLPPQREWVIKDFLPSKIVATIIAAGGTGKSFLAMHIGVSAASGTALFNKHQPKRAVKVVFISGEDDAGELQRRLHKVVSGLSSQARELINQNLHFIDLADSFELFTEKNRNGEIRITSNPGLICDQIIAQVGPEIGLVIVDPISRFRGGEENLAADSTRFVQALQQIRDQLNTCVLCLHHVNKSSGTSGSQNNSRGSSAFIDGVRLVFQLNSMAEKEIKNTYGGSLELPQILVVQAVKSNYGKPAETMYLERRDDGSLQLFDLMASDGQQTALLKEIQTCNLSKTQFKELYGGVNKKFGLGEKALLQKLELLNRDGLIETPSRNAMTVTEAGKKLIVL
jgi:hypothetical protein